MRGRGALSVAFLASAVTLLVGCVADSDAAQPCDALGPDAETAGAAFAPLVIGMNSVEDAEERLEMLDEVTEIPAGLTEDWEAWRGYLENAVDSFAADPAGVMISYGDVQASAAALRDYYASACR